MDLKHTLTALAFLLLTVKAVAADEPTPRPGTVVEPTKQSTPVPVENYSDLFPGPSGGGAHEQPAQKVVNQTPMPIYESWDVLRQYPRYSPVPKSTEPDESKVDK